MNVVVFEDRAVSQLYPITTGRAAYAISCGSYRLVDLIGGLGNRFVGVVRPHLESIQLQDFPLFQSQLDPRQPWTLLINARVVPSQANLATLTDFCERANQLTDAAASLTDGLVMKSGYEIGAVLLATSELIALGDFARGGGSVQWNQRLDGFEQLQHSREFEPAHPLTLFQFPHDVVRFNMQILSENLAHRIATGSYEQFEHGVFLGRGVKYGHHVVFDASQGPIVVDDQASLGPFSLLRGPVYLGPHARLSEYASVKDHVSIAHHSKIGGEVEATVIEAYSNKQHHGFLGHSYLGSWINLGAGTCNSDLKNTYGQVNVEYFGKKVSTGMQFFGCVIGDYSKTAINTSIFTGKVIGNASMIYGFATTNVPSFVNYARTFNEMGLLPVEVIVSTQARMFERRNVTQRPCDIQLIHDMFRLTAAERPDELSDNPLTL